MEQEEQTKICKCCGDELPISEFRFAKGGVRTRTCNRCIRKNRAQRGGEMPPFSDPDFDGKQPVEVIQLMTRAKRWLEALGYTITLRGEYREVKVRQIKFI